MTKEGYKVVGLEQGKDSSVKDYVGSKDELKYTHRGEMMGSLAKSTFTLRNDLDQTALPIRNKSFVNIGTDVGGGGKHWSGQTHRYFPHEFEIRSKTIERYGEDKIPKGMTIQDWDITYEELEPYYDKMENTLGISGEEDPLAGPRSNPYPTPPLKKTPSMKSFNKAAKNLGYSPFVIPSANLSEKFENPDGETINACQYCSFCGEFGCDFGAKSDPVITVIPTAQKTGNFDLRTHSRVKRVLYNGDKATGVLYEDTQTGEEFEQPADIVVLTSYTFNNTRLLLLSEIGKPYDPKTGEGVIGKNFTDHHKFPGVKGYFEEKHNSFIGTGTLGETFSDFSADNFDHSDLDFLDGGQIMLQEFGNLPIGGNSIPNDGPTWGREFKKQALYYNHRTLELRSQRSILPRQEHYLDLDPTYTDDEGDPLLRITWDYSEQDNNMAEFLMEKSVEILEEMGADIIEKNKLPDHFEGDLAFQHNSGGVIMGSDPDTSAVNNYMQMWEMDNLFVCGASSFPHFGTTNPTLTFGALTYRATEGMIEYLKNGEGLLVDAKKDKQKA